MPFSFFNIHSVAKSKKVEGGSFRDTKKRKNVSQNRNNKAPYLRKSRISKIAKGLQSVKVFSSTVPENPKQLDRIGAPGALKGGPFHILTSIVAKHQENEGGPFGEKFFTMPKKLKRGSFSLSRFCMLRGKRGKTFLVQFAIPNDSIWDHKFRITIENYFGQFVWIENKITKESQ